MKNLKTFLSFSKQLDVSNVKCLAKGRDKLGQNQFDNSAEIIFSTDCCVYSYSFFSHELICLCNIPEKLNLSLSDESGIVALKHDDMSDSFIVCLKSGDIVSFQFDDGVVGDVNVLASVPGGVDSVQWSPDFENVIMSNSSALYLLSATFYEIQNELDLCNITGDEHSMVNVGWGKKETQFHGSEGKAAAKKSKVSIDSNLICDDHRTFISWRGDSQIFSVSYWNNNLSLRFIKIFDKSGNLLAINEELPGLAGPISWRPCGDLLAFSERLPEHFVIGFLEKNGLKHGDFNIPADLKVKAVSWNCDSSILALVCIENSSNTESLLLWTTSNYHWYLKQTITLKSSLVDLLWDEVRGSRLYGVCSDSTVFVVEWITTVDSSIEWCHGSESSYAAVIDSDEILLTSFKEAIIPPPMSRWALKSSEPINCILFPSWPSTEFTEKNEIVLCSITLSYKFIIWRRDGSDMAVWTTLLLTDESDISINSLHHWQWISPYSFIALRILSGTQSFIELFENNDGTLIKKSCKALEFCPISLNYFEGDCLIQSTTGDLYKYKFGDDTAVKWMKLPEICSRVLFSSTGVYSLSEKNRLYKDAEHIGSQTTSFLLHGSFLIATTSLHTLVMYRISRDKCSEISKRKLENGSRLVVATETTIVLQLPRGNLEAIQPRALTVETAGHLLDTGQYKEAISLLLRQRIDLNLAVDHNPSRFFESIGEFVEQVDPKWLTLFITELKPESVTSTLYSDFYDKDHFKLSCDKVEKVSRCLHSEMMRSQDRFILPLLCSLVKLGSMPDALKLAVSEDSLEHLLFLVDVDKLYNEALLAYNLEAALRIAGKSQRDPKEYIPYLNKLGSMESNYMKYSIDKSLNRPESALKHIAQCQGDDKFNECLHLVKENCLYSSALKLFSTDSDKYKTIAELYGDYLVNLKRYAEAGVMYKRSFAPRKAVDPYLKLGDWRECISLSNECGYSDKEKELLIQTLKGVLKGSHRYHDAATLCLEIMNDVHLCVEMLVMGKHWKEAVYLAKSRAHESLIETIIKKHLSEHADSLKEDIQNNMDQLSKYCQRLQTVREDKTKAQLLPVADPWDIQSDTSSVSSLRTGNSSSVSRSSKNTRKANRKMWSLKEGNPREEQALISTLANIMATVEKLANEVQTTSMTLVELRCDETASLLQSKFKLLLESSSKSKLLIWPKDPDVDEVTLMDDRLKIPPVASVLPEWELHILK